MSQPYPQRVKYIKLNTPKLTRKMLISRYELLKPHDITTITKRFPEIDNAKKQTKGVNIPRVS